MRTFSDTPKTFTFRYTFRDFDTAQVACHAILGYMTGTYEQPVIDATYHNDDQGGHANQLVLKYAEDRKLSKVFKRICDSFKDYYNQPADMTDEELDDMDQENELIKEVKMCNDNQLFTKEYIAKRTTQLEDIDKTILIRDIIAYELELLDYADRLLSYKSIRMDSETAQGTIELMDDNVINLVKELDTEREYQGLHNYVIS